MSSLSVAAPRKLPFWRTVGACYQIVGRNFGQLIRISWLWLLIMLPVYAVVHWLAWSRGVEGGIIGQAVTVYLRLDRVVWWYALVLLAFLVLTLGPFLVVGGQASALVDNPDDTQAWVSVALVFIAIALGVAIALFVLPRLSLVLPAIALGERLSLADAWRVTRGSTWRLAGATLLCSLPPLIPLISAVLVRRYCGADRVGDRRYHFFAGLRARGHDRGDAAVAGLPAFGIAAGS